MLVAFAALLIHPQLAPRVGAPAERAALELPAATVVSAAPDPADPALPPAAPSTSETAAPLETESRAPLPDAPVAAPVPVNVPSPVAFLRSGKPATVSINELIAENHRKQIWWRSLAIASSGAATFDAWSTRHTITTAGAQELNPLLKPFAGNSSLYAAIQVAPLLMDYAGHKMMYSRHSWLRRMWWVPQSASFVSSLACGAHNLSYH